MNIEDAPEMVAEYLDYIIKFTTNPAVALQPYEGFGEISPKLFIFALIGAVLSLLIVINAPKMGIILDEKYIKKSYGAVIARFILIGGELISLPIVSVLLIFVLSILFHVIARIGMAIEKIMGIQNVYLGGTIQDTINASFAFSAFFIPFWVAYILIDTSTRDKIGLTKRFPIYGAIIEKLFVGIIPAMVFFLYFFSAISATHPNTSWWQAFSTISTPFYVFFPLLIIWWLLNLLGQYFLRGWADFLVDIKKIKTQTFQLKGSAGLILVTFVIILLAFVGGILLPNDLSEEVLLPTTPEKTPIPTITPNPTTTTPLPIKKATISLKAISPANIEQVTQLKALKSNWVSQLTWSPDGKLLGIAGYGVSLFDTTPFQQTCKIDIGWVNSVAFSPDGQTFATGSDKGIKMWNVDGCGELGSFDLTDNTNSVVFSPDGMKLAAGVGMMVKLFNVGTKNELKTFIGHRVPVHSVTFSPDGQTVASGSDNVKLWNMTSGREINTLEQDNVFSVAFSPDGKILASGSIGSYDDIKLWDVASGHILRTLTGHTGQIESIAFSPDGKLLASASWDFTVRLWDIESGKELRNLTGHTDWLRSTVFSPDGSLLASGGNDKTIRLWGIGETK